MGKVLFDSRDELSQKYVDSVRTNYVAPMNALADAIRELHIGNVTREMLHDAIFNKCAEIERAFRAEMAKIDTNAVFHDFAENVISERMEMVYDAAGVITAGANTIFNGMATNNPALFAWIDVDVDGVHLTDAAREKIRDAARIYIKSDTGVKLFNLQKKIVDAMQQFNQVAESAGMGQLAFMVTTCKLPLFQRHEDAAGNVTISAFKINFDITQTD